MHLDNRPKLHLEFLDSFRGIAIIFVFLFHIATPPSGFELEMKQPWSLIAYALRENVGLLSHVEAVGTILLLYVCNIGWCGVAIFFVVSGFCIQLAFCQSSGRTVSAFYIRRVFRIYPPYVFALVIFAILFPVSRLPFTKLTHWAQLITHILLFHNFSSLSCWAIDPDYWTIAVEAQLYLLFPLVLLSVRRWRWGITLFALGLIEFTLCVICAVCHTLSVEPPAWLGSSPFLFWFSWSIGAAIADAYLNERPLPFQHSSAALWMLSALVASSFPIANHVFAFSFFALFTATIICRKLSDPTPALQTPSVFGRYLRTAGRWSFSLYLIHHPILIAVAALYRSKFPGMTEHPFLSFAAGLSSWIIVFPLSGLMYKFVERPSISLGKKVLNRWEKRSWFRQLEATSGIRTN